MANVTYHLTETYQPQLDGTVVFIGTKETLSQPCKIAALFPQYAMAVGRLKPKRDNHDSCEFLTESDTRVVVACLPTCVSRHNTPTQSHSVRPLFIHPAYIPLLPYHH